MNKCASLFSLPFPLKIIQEKKINLNFKKTPIRKTIAAGLAVVCILSTPLNVSAFSGYSVKKVENGIRLEIHDAKEDEKFEASIDGGINWFPVEGGATVIKNRKPGDYQVTVRKIGSDETNNNITVIHLPDEGEKATLNMRVSTKGTRGDSLDGMICVNIPEYKKDTDYFITYDGGQSWHPAKSKTTVYKGLKPGYYNVIVRSEKPKLQSYKFKAFVPRVSPLKGSAYVKVKSVLQNPELPTGCEVTALAMAVNHCGVGVTKTVLADNYLEKTKFQDASPSRKFIGDPHTKHGYGCFSPVIEKCAHNLLDSIPKREFEIKNLDGSSLETILLETEKGTPVIAWATIDMLPPFLSRSWVDKETKEKVTWVAREHCLLITGYDLKKNLVYVNDPLKGSVAYDMTVFEERYDQLGRQAITIKEIKDQ